MLRRLADSKTCITRDKSFACAVELQKPGLRRTPRQLNNRQRIELQVGKTGAAIQEFMNAHYASNIVARLHFLWICSTSLYNLYYINRLNKV